VVASKFFVKSSARKLVRVPVLLDFKVVVGAVLCLSAFTSAEETL